jgi:hypothetical protein
VPSKITDTLSSFIGSNANIRGGIWPENSRRFLYRYHAARNLPRHSPPLSNWS